MALIPWRPFEDPEGFFEEDDFFLPAIPRGRLFAPKMDVYETDKEVVAEIDVPGVDPKNINVSVQAGVLTIIGTTEEKKEEKKKGFFRKEIRRGSFERSVRLPVGVKEDKVSAEYSDGVLKITMPKAKVARTKVKKVAVKPVKAAKKAAKTKSAKKKVAKKKKTKRVAKKKRKK